MKAYEISVSGHVDRELLGGLGALDVHERPATTVLRGTLGEDRGLGAVLDRLHALGIELLEVRQLDADDRPVR
jgi:hypothetical protein